MSPDRVLLSIICAEPKCKPHEVPDRKACFPKFLPRDKVPRWFGNGAEISLGTPSCGETDILSSGILENSV